MTFRSKATIKDSKTRHDWRGRVRGGVDERGVDEHHGGERGRGTHRGFLRSPVPTTIRQNVLNAMHDSGEHLPIRVKILVVVQAAAL